MKEGPFIRCFSDPHYNYLILSLCLEGFGTAIAINSFVIGYKKHLLRSFIDGYSVISRQKI